MKSIISFFKYKKLLKINRKNLADNKINVDWVYRLYTVYTFTDEQLMNIKSYGMPYVEDMLLRHVKKINALFLKNGLFEFVDIEKTQQLNDRQVGISYRFKFFDTAKLTKRILWFIVFSMFTGVPFLIYPKIISICLGLLISIILYVIVKSIKY